MFIDIYNTKKKFKILYVCPYSTVNECTFLNQKKNYKTDRVHEMNFTICFLNKSQMDAYQISKRISHETARIKTHVACKGSLAFTFFFFFFRLEIYFFL